MFISIYNFYSDHKVKISIKVISLGLIVRGVSLLTCPLWLQPQEPRLVQPSGLERLSSRAGCSKTAVSVGLQARGRTYYGNAPGDTLPRAPKCVPEDGGRLSNTRGRSILCLGNRGCMGTAQLP